PYTTLFRSQCSDSHGAAVVNSSSSADEPSANPPSRPTIRPAQRQSPASHSTGHPGADDLSGAHDQQSLPSRRELRRREAEAAAAQGRPTAVYSDAPPMYAEQATQAMPAASQAMPAAGGGHLGDGRPDASGRRRRRRPAQRGRLVPIRATVRTLGALCITAGLVLTLFLVWQLSWTDNPATRDHEVLADELTQDCANQDRNERAHHPDDPVVADRVGKTRA